VSSIDLVELPVSLLLEEVGLSAFLNSLESSIDVSLFSVIGGFQLSKLLVCLFVMEFGFFK